MRPEVQKEMDILLNTYLNKKLFTSLDENKKEIAFSNYNIELIIRPECNQTCEYCYIYKHGDKIFPKEKRVSNEVTLNNIDILLEFLFNEKKCYPPGWEIYAGDLFYDNIWFDLMDIFIKHYTKLYDENQFFKDNITEIVMPCNLSFCKDDQKIKKVEEYLEKLKKINIRFMFSYSTDGLYAVDYREKTKEANQNWFDKTFDFCNKHKFGYHPMISYENIDNSIKNYDWWFNQLAKYNGYQGHAKNLHGNTNLYLPMFLEVRNDGWTDEKIQKYLMLLEHMLQHRLELCENNIEHLTKHLFVRYEATERPELLTRLKENDLIRLNIRNHQGNSPTCAVGFLISINCANLHISPCHRLAYPHLTAGYFEINKKENKINDIKANYGLNGYINMHDVNMFYMSGCSNCEVKYFCYGGCLGSQYESNTDPFIQIPSVCRLLKAKYAYLIKRYYELGVIDCMLKDEEIDEHIKTKIINYMRYMGYEI